jgi:hypothetical protein
MKKRVVNGKLNLQKSQVAILNTSGIVGGKTAHCETRDTMCLRCSLVVCYTDVLCYETETCAPADGSEITCESSPTFCC